MVCNVYGIYVMSCVWYICHYVAFCRYVLLPSIQHVCSHLTASQINLTGSQIRPSSKSWGLNESCLLYMSHVSYTWAMSLIHESCLLYMSHVSYTWVASPTHGSYVSCTRVVSLIHVSRLSYTWIWSRTDDSSASYIWVMSRILESMIPLWYMSHVSSLVPVPSHRTRRTSR